LLDVSFEIGADGMLARYLLAQIADARKFPVVVNKDVVSFQAACFTIFS
jgi:hypothetical protein